MYTLQIKPTSLFLLPFRDGIHIRFFFNPKILPRILFPYINDREANYGVDTSLGRQDGPESRRRKVLIEFSSPNIAREFTAAHLKSTILGAFVANIHEAMGWDVIRLNFLGDWGKHLGLLGLGWQKYGSEKALNDETELFRYIHDLYTRMEDELQPEVEARKKAREDGQDTAVLETQGMFAERDATFKRMEDGEAEAIELWKKLRDITIDYYVKTYARLGIKFDSYLGESQVSLKTEALAEVESVLTSKGIIEEKDGARVIEYDKYGVKLGTGIILNRDGSTTYLLRDIATVFDRFKTYSFDKMLYVVCEQDVHFRQVFKAIELMGHADLAEKLKHITFSKAGGSSSHRGVTQLLGDVLDQCEENMREAIDADPDEYHVEGFDIDAKVMGINSLTVQELCSKKAQSNILGFSLMTEVGEQTGPLLQICHARLRSAILNTGMHPTREEIFHIDYTSLWEPPWCNLIRLMARYPDVVSSAFRTLDPSTILSYLFRVVEELTSCLDEADEDQSGGEGSNAGLKYVARTVLYDGVQQVLENGMKLLGLLPSI
jgi:arginyl-tRNA synthetase